MQNASKASFCLRNLRSFNKSLTCCPRFSTLQGAGKTVSFGCSVFIFFFALVVLLYIIIIISNNVGEEWQIVRCC